MKMTMFAFSVFEGHCRNPQTEALLQLLGLEYCLDTSTQVEELSQSQLLPGGKYLLIHACDAYFAS